MAGKSQGSLESDRFDLKNVGPNFAHKVRAHQQGKNEALKRIQLLFDRAMDTYANGLPGEQVPPMTGPTLDLNKHSRPTRRIEDTESNDEEDVVSKSSGHFDDSSSELSSSESVGQRIGFKTESPPSATGEITHSKMMPSIDQSPPHIQQILSKPFSDQIFQTHLFHPISSTEQFQITSLQPRLPKSGFDRKPRHQFLSGKHDDTQVTKDELDPKMIDWTQRADVPEFHCAKSAHNDISLVNHEKVDLTSKLKFLESLFHLTSRKSSPSASKKSRIKFMNGEASPQSCTTRTTQDPHIFKITKPYYAGKMTKLFTASISKSTAALPESLTKSSLSSPKSRPSSSFSRSKGPRPFSVPKVPCYERFDLTVPIPFDLTKPRGRKQAQMPEMPTKIHAHPVPLTSQLPLYDPEWEEAERWKRRQARMVQVSSQIKPFQLHISTNLRKSHSASMPNLQPKSPTIITKPPAHQDRVLEMEQWEDLRKLQIQWRSEELLSMAKAPFSSSRHQQLIDKKYSRPSSAANTIHRSSAAQWPKTTTVPQPFNLSKQRLCKEFVHYLDTLTSKKNLASPKKVVSTKKTSSAIKLNHATALRHQAIRKKMAKQAEETVRQRKVETDRRRKEADRMQDLALVLQAHGLETGTDSDKLLRLRELRLAEACKEEAYHQFLEEMKLRVEARPYILEQLTSDRKIPRSKMAEDEVASKEAEEDLEEKLLSS